MSCKDNLKNSKAFNRCCCLSTDALCPKRSLRVSGPLSLQDTLPALFIENFHFLSIFILVKKSLNKAVSVLKAGGVVVHATETCYGLACDAFDKDALRKLYRLKNMDFKKPISIIVSDLKMAKKYGVFSAKALTLAKKHWPGPLTIVVKRKASLPAHLNQSAKTIGFRVPAHKFSLNIVRLLKGPITTTSANISGEPSPYSISAVKKQFRGRKLKPDFFINEGKLKKNPPSTVVDYSQKTPKILRQGSMVI